MVKIVEEVYERLEEIDREYRDPYSLKYFLISNVWHFVAVVVSYYVFVMYIGPKLMAKRKPFQLHGPLAVYNILQIILNGSYLLTIILAIVIEQPYPSLLCMFRLEPGSRMGNFELHLHYCYFLLKILDLFDTVFFVLKKNYRQVTFLHVYHHMMMTIAAFSIIRYNGSGGLNIGVGVVNSFIHAVMYFYYYQSASRPEMKNSLWWKKYITQMQLVQFIFVTTLSLFYLLLPGCGDCKTMATFFVSQGVVMITLFSNFYYKTYIRKARKEGKGNLEIRAANLNTRKIQ